MTLLDRFLKYVSFDTQSDPTSSATPSTAGQTALLQYLADELRGFGAADVELHKHGYLTATIPASEGCEDAPTIGFLAHVDTSPDASGANVRPQISRSGPGGDETGPASDAADATSISGIDASSDTVIASDGTTLLGADDKAGVAEIMTAAEILLGGHLLENLPAEGSQHQESPEDPQHQDFQRPINHGRIRIAFTSDEEIGRGVDNFDVEKFGADFAYTVDGGAEGELEYENFNAAEASVVIHGKSAHPGDAKGKMINALRVAMEFDGLLPADERPETTEGYEGFFHLTHLAGSVARAETGYLIRDHDRSKFEARKNAMREAAQRMDKKYGAGTVAVTIRDEYYNMREVIENHPFVVERARKAMLAAGVTPVIKPIRGGTDGARLSQMGLPCPNIFTGGENFHGTSERVSLGAMQKAVRTIIEIARV